jgi:hypothetical protein
MEEGWRRLMDEQWLHDCMEEWRDYGHLCIRAKWTMDGATTLAEAAARFRARAGELDELARAGFELEQPVSDDYAFIVRPGEESPMRLVEEDE